MKFRQFKNEKGLTLVELLAALSLFGVLIALASTLIIQLMGSEKQASGDISLSQDTNVLINELRNEYINKSNEVDSDTKDFDICFQDFDGLMIDQVIIEKETLNVKDNCIKDIKKQEVLPITITTTNDAGQTLTVSTTWRINNEYVLDITGNSDEMPNDFIDGDPFVQCEFYNNTRFSLDQIDKDATSCAEIKVHNSSALFSNNNLSIHNVIFTIDKNLYADQSFRLDNTTEINVAKDTFLGQDIQLFSTTSLNTQNLDVKGTVRLHNSSGISIRENATFEQDIELQSNTSINTKSLDAKDTVKLGNSSIISIRENATFGNYVSLMGDASLTIGGDAYFYDGVDLQNRNKIIVEGDAHFHGPVGPDWQSGSICVKGDATFDSTTGNRLKIEENASSCN